MRRTCNRVFRYGFAWAEESANKIVFTVTWSRYAHHFSQGKHAIDIRAYSFDLLPILHYYQVITRHAHFFAFCDAQRVQQ
ncbi:Uncharacterised protein [Serratia liquefaciens]|nr:Uncharacterised protein [Serratia liquefaciens]